MAPSVEMATFLDSYRRGGATTPPLSRGWGVGSNVSSGSWLSLSSRSNVSRELGETSGSVPCDDDAGGRGQDSRVEEGTELGDELGLASLLGHGERGVWGEGERSETRLDDK
jgi:hypothetical protein